MERLVLFAKAPRLNEVKTRLAPLLTAEHALELHEAMLCDQLRFTGALAGPERTCEVCLDAPFAPEGELARALVRLEVTQQGEGDLGERMHRALDRAFAHGASRAMILGADAPTLPASLVEAASAALRRGAGAVIVPATDGGYVLIGASPPVPPLFAGVPWGTPDVADATRRRACESGCRLAEIAPWPDVDVADDLPRLASDLADDPDRAPATARLLLRLGLYGGGKPML